MPHGGTRAALPPERVRTYVCCAGFKEPYFQGVRVKGEIIEFLVSALDVETQFLSLKYAPTVETPSGTPDCIASMELLGAELGIFRCSEVCLEQSGRSRRLKRERRMSLFLRAAPFVVPLLL